MLAYWVLLSVFAGGALLFEGRRSGLRQLNLLLAVAAIGMVLFIGLRYKVGADWEPYRLIFWDMRFTPFREAFIRSDPGFATLNWLVRRAGLEIWVVNLAGAAMFVFGLYRFAQHQTSPWLTFTVAVPYFVIVVGMGYNRQSIALGFILLALLAIQHRAFIRFLVLMLIAATFHRSAAILLPFIALSYSKNRFLTVVLTLVVSIIGYFFIVAPEVDTYLNRYSGAEQGDIESSGTLVRLLMNLVPALIFIGMRGRLPATGDYAKVWRNLSLATLASLAAYAYFGNNTAVDRLAIYLAPLQLFVLGNLPMALGGRRGSSKLVAVLVVMYSVAVQVVWLMLATNAKFWIPYRTYPL